MDMKIEKNIMYGIILAMEDNFTKDFDGWIELKKDMDKFGKLPTINEGEVWWCGVGTNVGVEISGKGQRYSRPVLVLKKLSKFGFMAVPLTSKPKEGSWYVSFEFQGMIQTAVVGQARVISTQRLNEKMGQVPKSDLEKVRNGFLRLYKK